MSKRKASIFKTLLTILILGLIIGGIVIAVIKLSKDSDVTTISTQKPYSVTYDGVRYIESSEDIYITLPDNGTARFEVKNGGDFTVDVLPNTSSSRDFEFTVDNTPYIFSQEGSLKQAFTITTGDGYFEVVCDRVYNVQTVLNYLYASNVTLVDSVPIYPFKFVITSADGATIEIPFEQYSSDLTISLDANHIYF
jgi:hypothetical protein